MGQVWRRIAVPHWRGTVDPAVEAETPTWDLLQPMNDPSIQGLPNDIAKNLADETSFLLQIVSACPSTKANKQPPRSALA